MSNKEIKRNAREKLDKSFKGDKFVFFSFVFRIFLTIIGIISLAVYYCQLRNKLLGIVNPIINITVLVISLQIPFIPFNYSFDRKMIKLFNKNNDYNFSDFFFYYKNNPVSVIVVELLKYLYLFLWLFTFVGPFIKFFSYSMSSYLKIDNPNLSATEAITKSRKLMKGYKFRLFCLYLSFVGWYLLSILTLGAIYPFVRVYLKMSEIEFYNYIKEKNDISSIYVLKSDPINNLDIEKEYIDKSSNYLRNKNSYFILTILLSIASFVGLNYIDNTIKRNYYNQLDTVDVISYNLILDKFTLKIKDKENDSWKFFVTLRFY